MSMTVPEAARRWGRDPETVRRWIRSGRLQAKKVGTQYLVESANPPGRNEFEIPRPEWLRHTITGEPMPDVVRFLRRQRQEH